MKNIKTLTIALSLVTAGLVTLAFTKVKPVAKAATTNKGFAVVELFTSEGCSSCPPADAVIAKIKKEVTDKPVYLLAYHVDYWNRLGWKDVFSSADFSRRQNDYANWLKLSSVYTPQVVVNGKTEFVGSQEGTLRKAINTGLEKEAKTTLLLTNLRTGAGKATITYQTDATANNQTLLVALIQKNATTIVKSGENGGRTLSHVQIVNNIQNIPLSGKTGEAAIVLPKNFIAVNYELIAFVQNNRNGEITAATHLPFPVAVTASN